MSGLLDAAESHSPTPPSDTQMRDRTQPRLRRSQGVQQSSGRQQWREEFPYHWDADDLVTRRDTLCFLVAGTGALFIATGTLATIGSLLSAPQVHAVPVVRLGELAENETCVFVVPDQYGQGIVVNLPGRGLVAYSDGCTHLSCAVLYQPRERQFYCPCHEGRFDAATGNVLAGPPTRPLPIITLRVRGGIVYAVREVPR